MFRFRYTVKGWSSVDSILEDFCIGKGKDAGLKGVSVLQGHIGRLEGARLSICWIVLVGGSAQSISW